MKIFAPLWAAGTVYAVLDAVEFDSRYYRCTVAHTSTGVTIDTNKFVLIVLGDNYRSDLRDMIYSDAFMAVDLVEFHIPGTPFYLCTGPYSIAVNTDTAPTAGVNTYTAQGQFIGFSTVTEDFDVKVGKFSVYLSGLSDVSLATDPNISGNRVVIHKCFLELSTGVVVDQPILVFDGQITNVAITESARSASITVDCASIFADFERSAGRKTNNESNWLYQGIKYDTTFEKSGLLKNTEIKWGRA